MKNFTHYIKGTNSENIEFFIGKGSGNKIEKDLENAKKEIIIVSPYISEEKIDLLLNKKNKGINVQLAFSSLNDDKRSSTLEKLINKKPLIDEELKNTIDEKLKKLKSKSMYNNLISLFLFLFGLYNSSLIVIVAIVFFLIINSNLIKTKKNLLNTYIVKYKFEKKLNFTYLNNNFRHDKMFIHSKIYIIDDEIAYLGSVNFTFNGFKENLETRIRITDKKTVSKLKEFTSELFEENKKLSHKLDWLGNFFNNESKNNMTYQYFLDKKLNNKQSDKTSNFEKVIKRNESV